MEPQQQSPQLSAEERQAALDSVSTEYLQKLIAVEGTGIVLDTEWMLLAEFALLYGWQAYKDARDDNISLDEMVTLIMAARKLKASDKYDLAHAVLIGAGSAGSTEPGQTFEKMTKEIVKNMKVGDE